MSTTSRHTRILAIPIAGLAMVMAGLVATPIQAVAKAAKITVTVHIVNAKGEPIPDLVVGAYTKNKWADLKANSKVPGDYKTTKMTKGTWTIEAYDNFEYGRYLDYDGEYTVVAGSNAVPTITMDLGAVVEGNVTAPSGHALNNVVLTASQGDAQDTDNLENIGFSEENGDFSIAGIRPGTFNFGYLVEYEDFVIVPIDAPSRTLEVGQVSTGLAVTDVVVPADMSLKGKSSSKRKATLTVKKIGAFFGITNPGGTVTVTEGKTTLVSGVAVIEGTTTIPLAGLKKGKHKFTVSYSGGTDVKSQNKKVTVKVK